jgi:beta-aspartyl-peptidase (threonine type)
MDSGYALLSAGGTAQDAVSIAIIILENAPRFNAGKGAVMNAEANHELAASIMIGNDRDTGAIAGATTIKNPILGAIAVMEETPHVMLAGEGADLLAKKEGLEQVENDYFTTEKVRSRWDKLQSAVSKSEFEKFGTVGAVAIDQYGNIAAGTSTEGMMCK